MMTNIWKKTPFWVALCQGLKDTVIVEAINLKIFVIACLIANYLITFGIGEGLVSRRTGVVQSTISRIMVFIVLISINNTCLIIT